MDILRDIQSWLYPLIDLGVMIFCLVGLKRKGAGLIAAGFGLQAFTSLSWSIINTFVVSNYDYQDISWIYTAMGHLGFILHIAFALLVVFGLIQLTQSSPTATSGSAPTGQNRLASTATSPMYSPPQSDLQGSSKFGSTMLFVSLLITAVVLFIAGGVALTERRLEEVGLTFIIVGVIVYIAAQIYYLVMLYRCWNFTINGLKTRDILPAIDSPGKAVGFLFIPLFNFYWVFMAYGKLPNSINQLSAANGLNTRMPEGLGLTFAILAVMGIIPFLGYLTTVIAYFVIAPIFISQAMAACKEIETQL